MPVRTFSFSFRARPLVFGLAIAASLAACAAPAKKATWTRPGATERDVSSAKYWCTKVTYEKYYKFNVSGTDERRRYAKLDEECMRNRGFKKVDQ